MLKRIFMLFSIITTLHLNAMDEPMDSAADVSATTDTCCYLAMLPVDIQNIIAQFFTFDDIESEEEFITRTKTTINKRVPQYCYKHLSESVWGNSQSKDILTGFCPNGTKAIILKLFCGPNPRTGNSMTPGLVIVDAQNTLLHSESLPGFTYKRVALSRCGKLDLMRNKND